MLLGCPDSRRLAMDTVKVELEKQRGALGKGLMPFGTREFIWILSQLGKDDAVLVSVKTLGFLAKKKCKDIGFLNACGTLGLNNFRLVRGKLRKRLVISPDRHCEGIRITILHTIKYSQ